MPFASGLLESLEIRGSEVPSEFTRGDSLESILNRHLLAVERMAEVELFTSILLLSHDGKRLSHGAAPNLPRSYRDAIDGSEIGPCAGSCGTAAYFGRPVYVSDLATDPLWADYHHLALPHGLRSCWSTPIREPSGSIVGTFAIYHRTTGGPTNDEIEAIDLITEHVAKAILWARDKQDLDPLPTSHPPHLQLVGTAVAPDTDPGWSDRLVTYVERLESLADDLDRRADAEGSEATRTRLRAVVTDSRRLITTIRHQLEQGGRSGL